MKKSAFNLRMFGRAALLIAMLVFAAFPLYWMANTALSSDAQMYASGQGAWLQLHNLPVLLTKLHQVPLWRWMLNTVTIAGGTTILSLVLGMLAAYALSRFRFHGRGFVGFLLFVTQVVPEALIVVPLYTMFIAMGLLDHLTGLILANVGFSLPVSIFILKGAMDAIPIELEEAASLDNCPRISILMMIVLPLIMPSVAAAAVIAFFTGWNEYLFASTFLKDQSLWPASVGLASFIGQYETPMSAVMGSALVFSLPAIAFFLMIQRKIVSGLTSGAVKG